MSAFTTLIQQSYMKRNKITQIGKEEVKLSLFGDDVILYIEHSDDSTKKLLEWINGFSKIARYKINIQKSGAFLYTNNELSERETRKTIPFIVVSKIYRNKFNQGCKRPLLRKLLDTKERNWRYQ